MVYRLIFFLIIALYDSELINVHLGGEIAFILKISSLVILFFLTKFNLKYIPGKLINIAYFILLIHAYLTLTSFSNTGIDGIIWSFKFLVRWSIYILSFINLGQHSINKILKLYRNIGVILAIQSIILYALIYLNISVPASIVTRHSDEDTFRSYGILGFGNALSGYYFRTQSFFSEATNFAKFLILPFFYQLNLVFQKKTNLTNYSLLIILVLGVISTFSFTAFNGIFLGIIVYFIIRKGTIKRFITLTPVLIGSGVLLINILKYILEQGRSKTEGRMLSAALEKDENSLNIRIEWIEYVGEIIQQNFMGLGYNLDPFLDWYLPLAPTRWLLFGGLISLILILNLHKLFFFRFSTLLSLKSENYRLLCCICMAHFFVSLIHGTWLEFIYWFNFFLLFWANVNETKINQHELNH